MASEWVDDDIIFILGELSLQPNNSLAASQQVSLVVSLVEMQNFDEMRVCQMTDQIEMKSLTIPHSALFLFKKRKCALMYQKMWGCWVVSMYMLIWQCISTVIKLCTQNTLLSSKCSSTFVEPHRSVFVRFVNHEEQIEAHLTQSLSS